MDEKFRMEVEREILQSLIFNKWLQYDQNLFTNEEEDKTYVRVLLFSAAVFATVSSTP